MTNVLLHLANTVLLFWLLLALTERAKSVATARVQESAGAVVALKNFPMQARLANAMVSYAHYLEKTFWPRSLAMLYPYEHWTVAQVTGSRPCLSRSRFWRFGSPHASRISLWAGFGSRARWCRS